MMSGINNLFRNKKYKMKFFWFRTKNEKKESVQLKL